MLRQFGISDEIVQRDLLGESDQVNVVRDLALEDRLARFIDRVIISSIAPHKTDAGSLVCIFGSNISYFDNSGPAYWKR